MSTYAISGSASGIGAATRAMLEREGHTVIGIDLRDAEVVADLSTADGRTAAVEATTERCDGRLDGVLTGAGVGPPAPADLTARVNFFGSRDLLIGLRPALATSGAAAAVQIGSNSTTVTPNLPDDVIEAFLADDEAGAITAISRTPAPFDSSIAYAGSKTAITRWCRRHATQPEWAGAGIRLNVIAPGAVQTPLLAQGQADETYGPLTESLPIPTGLGEPDDIAAWIVFMLSPAARFACGSVVFVDGGTDALLRTDDWPRSFEM